MCRLALTERSLAIHQTSSHTHRQRHHYARHQINVKLFNFQSTSKFQSKLTFSTKFSIVHKLSSLSHCDIGILQTDFSFIIYNSKVIVQNANEFMCLCVCEWHIFPHNTSPIHSQCHVAQLTIENSIYAILNRNQAKKIDSLLIFNRISSHDKTPLENTHTHFRHTSILLGRHFGSIGTQIKCDNEKKWKATVSFLFRSVFYLSDKTCKNATYLIVIL